MAYGHVTLGMYFVTLHYKEAGDVAALAPEASLLRSSRRDVWPCRICGPGIQFTATARALEAALAGNSPGSLFSSPHRRLNPLTGEWILVSPQRLDRPWLGLEDSSAHDVRPSYDPDCYLCPGNLRTGGVRNPDYAQTFIFTNDFPALEPDTPRTARDQPELLRAEGTAGTCRVLCFSPRHDLSLGELTTEAIHGVIDLWAAQSAELARSFRWVQVFENKGELMGASNPHPHGQIWATSSLPAQPAKEDRRQLAYLKDHRSTLLGDYAELELREQERLVVQTDHWLAVVPFWAVWPFELLLLPLRPILRLPELTDPERLDLAQVLKRILTRYDNLFRTPFPYSMGWHAAPNDSGDKFHWRLHAHLYPPLLRSAGVRKFMVGYEMMAEPQRDLQPEAAAERLRQLSDTHYRQPSA